MSIKIPANHEKRREKRRKEELFLSLNAVACLFSDEKQDTLDVWGSRENQIWHLSPAFIL